MIGWQLDVKSAHFKGKEDTSRNCGFKVSSPTRLGNNCSLIIFSYISKFSIVLGVVLARNESFS